MRRSGFVALLPLALIVAPAFAQIEAGRDRIGRVVFTNAPNGAYGASTSAPRRDETPPTVTRPSAMPGNLPALIRAAAVRHGLSPDLVHAVVAVESGFDPRAVSPKGARGLMQLMPETASELAVGDVYDPRANLDAGARHLRRLLDSYEGDLRLGLAAYNAGEAAVERYGGVPPYPETRQYVQRVLALLGRLETAGSTGAGPGLFRFRNDAGTVVMSNIPADALLRPVRIAKMP